MRHVLKKYKKLIEDLNFIEEQVALYGEVHSPPDNKNLEGLLYAIGAMSYELSEYKKKENADMQRLLESIVTGEKK